MANAKEEAEKEAAWAEAETEAERAEAEAEREKEDKTMYKEDYSKSAVNLCNPVEVLDLLMEYKEVKKTIVDLEEKLMQESTVYLALKQREQDIQIVDGLLRAAIDKFGSYHDSNTDLVAIKQRRIRKAYDARRFSELFPQFAPAIIEQTVNVPSLYGLIKGGLLSEEEIAPCVSESETFAYIII